MAVLAIPVMQAQFESSKILSKRNQTTRNAVVNSKPMQMMEWGARQATATPQLRAGGSYMWDFESDASFEGWGSYQASDDGYGWMVDDSGVAHSGDVCLVSYSYVSGEGAYDPDNWLISPTVPLNGILSFWALNYSSYFADMIAVYVCVGEPEYLSDFVLLEDNIYPPSSDWQEYTYDLSEYAGQEGCIAIRHYNSYNMYMVYIDDVSIQGPAVSAPIDLTADPDVTSADVAWTDVENPAWNLRYREVVPGVEENLLWDFEEDTNGNTDLSLTGGWTSIDADGDGEDWYHLYGVTGLKTHSGTGHVTSASYNGAALDPDNWLVSPMVKLDGEFSFWAASQDGSYPETFAVYVSTDMQNWEALEENIEAPSDMTQFTYDLTGYEGVDGYVAIRHYNTHDMFRLNVDDIAITYVKAAEWIEVENLSETNYTIEGLTPETTYEVQVQAMNEGETSDWTPSTVFTTLEEEVIQYTEAPTVETREGEKGDHSIYVTVTPNEDNCELQYRYKFDDGEWSEWMDYDGEFSFTEDGTYVVEARAKAGDKEWSLPSEDASETFVITPRTAVNELNGQKAVANVRYFNAIGQEMAQPNGMTIVVTTYTDGTTSAVKVMK